MSETHYDLMMTQLSPIGYYRTEKKTYSFRETGTGYSVETVGTPTIELLWSADRETAAIFMCGIITADKFANNKFKELHT